MPAMNVAFWCNIGMCQYCLLKKANTWDDPQHHVQDDRFPVDQHNGAFGLEQGRQEVPRREAGGEDSSETTESDLRLPLGQKPDMETAAAPDGEDVKESQEGDGCPSDAADSERDDTPHEDKSAAESSSKEYKGARTRSE